MYLYIFYFYFVLCIHPLGLVSDTFRKIEDDSLPGEAEYIGSVIFPMRISNGELQFPSEARILKLEDECCLHMVSPSHVQH